MPKSATTRPSGATSFRDTKFGILSRRELVKLEIRGIQRGLKYLISLSGRNIEITPQLIMRLHQKSFGWIFPKWAGKFRKIEVEFSGKQAPPFFNVPVLIKNLCDDLAERLKHIPSRKQPEKFLKEIISLVAWFQHGFVWIHPFNDYNGRTSRLLSNLLLLKFDLPAIEIKIESKKDRDAYIYALQSADNGDYSILEEIAANTLDEALKKNI